MAGYTPAQIEELKSIEGLNFEKATAFAEKHGLKPRSVVAKARALEIPYQSKVPGTKTKSAKPEVRRKSDIATNINELLDENLTSLDKMTIKDLEVLEAFIVHVMGA